MILEPVILVPWGVAQLRSVPLATVVIPGFWEVAWITVVMMSPFVMTAAVVNGLALQQVKKITTGQKDTQKEVRDKLKEHLSKPTTREEFLELVKKDPGIIKKSSPEVKELLGIDACQKTVYNWMMYAKEHDGYHAESIATK